MPSLPHAVTPLFSAAVPQVSVLQQHVSYEMCFVTGRVARAGRSGVSYSLVSPDEIPFLIDLHLFLGRTLKFADLTKPNTGMNMLIHLYDFGCGINNPYELVDI